MTDYNNTITNTNRSSAIRLRGRGGADASLVSAREKTNRYDCCPPLPNNLANFFFSKVIWQAPPSSVGCGRVSGAVAAGNAPPSLLPNNLAKFFFSKVIWQAPPSSVGCGRVSGPAESAVAMSSAPPSLQKNLFLFLCKIKNKS